MNTGVIISHVLAKGHSPQTARTNSAEDGNSWLFISVMVLVGCALIVYITL